MAYEDVSALASGGVGSVKVTRLKSLPTMSVVLTCEESDKKKA